MDEQTDGHPYIESWSRLKGVVVEGPSTIKNSRTVISLFSSFFAIFLERGLYCGKRSLFLLEERNAKKTPILFA